jgi:ribosome-associated translation inhibitor RaiA
MQASVQIDFQGAEPNEALRTRIDEQIAKLEKRFGRITAGRVVVAAPGRHHRSGGLFEVHVHRALPEGREVDVSRLSDDDERFADPVVAVDAAFRRAWRQLKTVKGLMAPRQPVQARAPTGEAAPLTQRALAFSMPKMAARRTSTPTAFVTARSPT